MMILPMMYMEKEMSLWYLTRKGRKSTLLMRTPNCSTKDSP